MAARIAVTVVLIFAPNLNGYNWRRLITPLPARGTIFLVVVDDDWTSTVTRVPEYSSGIAAN